jgi:Tol biopolymer transport system component
MPPTSVVTVRTNGTDKKVLTGPGNFNFSPSWTPDGKIIFISDRSGSAQIWIMDADGSNPQQIGNLYPDMGFAKPQQGRNGLISFQGGPDLLGNSAIWIMQKDGSGLKELVQGGQQPSLALSGKWLTYTVQTEQPYHREIYRINTDGTGLQQLTFLGDPDYPDANASSISPDETMVALFSGKEADEGAAGFTQSIFTWGHRNVAVILAGGGPRRALTSCKPVTTPAEIAALGPDDCIAADNPTWSPDGHWIIHDRGSTSGTQTWMIDVNGQNNRLLYPESRGTENVPMKYVWPRSIRFRPND